MKDTKKSKKKIWIALAIIVGAIVLSGAALGIATAIKRSNCEHVYGAWTVSEEVTCTEDGEEERECIECGKTETREIEHYGHEQRMVYAVEATCTTPGKTDGVQCIRCKKVLAGCEEVPARGHKPVTVDGYRAECLKDGLTSGVKCGRCDKVIESQKIIPATGHDVATLEALAPTCTRAGYSSHSYCKACGEVYVEKEDIAPLGHTDGVDVNSDVKCERCGLNGQEAYLEACQWEEAATVTKLSKGETIAAGEVAGAYSFNGKINSSPYTLMYFDGFSWEIDETIEIYGILSLDILLSTEKVILYWRSDGDYFEGELTTSFYYFDNGRVDFYLPDEFVLNIKAYSLKEGYLGEYTITVDLGTATVENEGLQRLELIG